MAGEGRVWRCVALVVGIRFAGNVRSLVPIDVQGDIITFNPAQGIRRIAVHLAGREKKAVREERGETNSRVDR